MGFLHPPISPLLSPNQYHRSNPTFPPPPPRELQREGHYLCNLIVKDLNEILPDTDIVPAVGSTKICIGDVCLRGGKWYFEVTVRVVDKSSLSVWNNPGILQSNLIFSVGWVNSTCTSLYNHIGSDNQSKSWGLSWANSALCYYSNSQYRNVILDTSSREDFNKKKKQTQPTQFSMMDGCVFGSFVDIDSRQIWWSVNGAIQENAFIDADFSGGIHPGISIYVYNPGVELEVNFGNRPFAFPPHPYEGINGIDMIFEPHNPPNQAEKPWLTRYRHAAEVTRLVFEEKSLPAPVLDLALSKELELTEKNRLKFVVASHDAKPQHGFSATGTFEQCGYFAVNAYSPLNIVYKIADTREATNAQESITTIQDFVLRGVSIQPSIHCACNFNFMVFVTQSTPDLEAFEWCNGFTEAHFQAFLEHKESLGEPFKPHEPIGYFQVQKRAVNPMFNLHQPMRGQFIVIKLMRSDDTTQSSIHIDNIMFSAIHGSHPLAEMIGTPQFDNHAIEVMQKLRDNSDLPRFWSRKHDAELVALIQSICIQLGISAANLDSIMINPKHEDFMKYKVFLLLLFCFVSFCFCSLLLSFTLFYSLFIITF